MLAKKILEKEKRDNTTLAKIHFFTDQKKISWEIRSFSRKEERFNSMQKATCVLPVILARLLLEKRIKDRGLLFLEKVGEDKKLFRKILSEIKKEKVLMLKRVKCN